MKALYQNNSPYFKKIGDDIKIVLGNLSALAESKTLEDKVKLTKTLGITLDFEISTLSKNEKDTLDSILLGIKNILLNYNAATILAGERVDFNASLDTLAEFQYKITSRTTETNHYNIDKSKPELVKVLLDREDITDHMIMLYGENRNWNNRTIYYKDFAKQQHIGKDLQVKWQRQNGRMDCVIVRIRDLESPFYGDLFFPSTAPSCIVNKN